MSFQKFGVILCLVLLFQSEGRTAEEYKSPDGSFRLVFPGVPDEHVTTKEGLTLQTLSAKSDSANALVVMLIYFDHPKAQRQNLNSAEFFRGAERTVLDFPNAKLLHGKDISQGTIPGKEWYIQGYQGKYARIQQYLTGDRAYQLFVVSEDEKGLDSAEAEEFLSSFHVIKADPLPRSNLNQSWENMWEGFGSLVGFAIVVGGLVLFILWMNGKGRRKETPRRNP